MNDKSYQILMLCMDLLGHHIYRRLARPIRRQAEARTPGHPSNAPGITTDDDELGRVSGRFPQQRVAGLEKHQRGDSIDLEVRAHGGRGRAQGRRGVSRNASVGDHGVEVGDDVMVLGLQLGYGGGGVGVAGAVEFDHHQLRAGWVGEGIEGL